MRFVTETRKPLFNGSPHQDFDKGRGGGEGGAKVAHLYGRRNQILSGGALHNC